MRKFAKYIFIVVLATVVVDAICRLVFQGLFNNPQENSKLFSIYKFESCEAPAEVVILGASKANHHYDVRQVEKTLNISAYNYGWDGSSIINQYLCLIKAINNGGLKVAILDLSPSQMGYEWVHERISDYWPYYWKNDTVRSIVNEVEGKDMRYLLSSSLIQYNSQLFNCFLHVNQYKGYNPLPFKGIPIKPIKSLVPVDEFKQSLIRETSPVAVKYLKRMRSICAEKNIELIICISPTLNYSSGNEDYLKELASLCKIECWDMSRDVTDGHLFSDEIHLNEKGAQLFTKHIIERLKSRI